MLFPDFSGQTLLKLQEVNSGRLLSYSIQTPSVIKGKEMGKICLKCGYERKLTDIAPDYECPSCGVVYAKYEAKFAKEKLQSKNKEFSNKADQNIPYENKSSSEWWYSKNNNFQEKINYNWFLKYIRVPKLLDGLLFRNWSKTIILNNCLYNKNLLVFVPCLLVIIAITSNIILFCSNPFFNVQSDYKLFLVFLYSLGLVPAWISLKKGYNPYMFFVYGVLGFPFALYYLLRTRHETTSFHDESVEVYSKTIFMWSRALLYIAIFTCWIASWNLIFVRENNAWESLYRMWGFNIFTYIPKVSLEGSTSSSILWGTLGLAIDLLFGLIPAQFAKEKGYSFYEFWVYGALLFVVALPSALMMKPIKNISNQHSLSLDDHRKCPFCSESIKAEATFCRYCRKDLTDVRKNT